MSLLLKFQTGGHLQFFIEKKIRKGKSKKTAKASFHGL